MNKNKISLIMSFILIFSLIVPVFAETILVDTGNKSENIDNEINIDENNNKDLLINDNSSLNSEITIDNSNSFERVQSGQGNEGEEPTQDFNEEIVEFKQYVRDITNDSNSKFSEHINYEQNKDKENIVEHIFTLKTKPLSRDYAAGELKIMPLGFERNNKMFKELGISDDAIFNVGRENSKKLLINLTSSDFFNISQDYENSFNLFNGNFYLTNKKQLQKGQSLDISYRYQEYLHDFFITNKSEVQEKTLINLKEYLGTKMKYSSPNIKLNANVNKTNAYEHHEALLTYVNTLSKNITDDIYEYASIDLSDHLKFRKYDFEPIYNKNTIYRSQDPISFAECYSRNSDNEILYEPYIVGASRYYNNVRLPLVFKDLNGTYPKLTFTADCPLIYVDKDGKKESFNTGEEITLVENGEAKRFFGDIYNNEYHNTRSKNLEGSFFAKRDVDKEKHVNLSFNIYNTRYKDDTELFNLKNFFNIEYRIFQYPNIDTPKIIDIVNTRDYSHDFLLEDLFLNNNNFFYNTSLIKKGLDYTNKSFKLPLKNIDIYLQGIMIYDANNLQDNLYFNTDYKYNSLSPATFKKYTEERKTFIRIGCNNDEKLNLSSILKSFKQKIKDYPDKKYKIKFIFKMTDDAGENKKPFFSNIKNVDISDKLTKFNNEDLNNLIKNVNVSNNDILFDLDKDVINYSAIHLFENKNSDISINNGKAFGDYFRFNAQNIRLSEVAIIPNDKFLNSVDDNTIFEYNFAFPENIFFQGNIETSIKSSIDPLIINKENFSLLSIRFTKKDLLKHIEKNSNNSPIYNIDTKSSNPYLFDIRCNGNILVKNDNFKSITTEAIFYDNNISNDAFKVLTKSKTSFIFVNNSVDSLIADINKNIYFNTIEKTLESPSFNYSYCPEENFETLMNHSQNFWLTPSSEFVAGIMNTIKGPDDSDFTLFPQRIDYSALYQNKISVQTASTPMTDTTIFYDIENAKPKFVNWKGILKGVDVSDIEKQGYKVEIHSNETAYSKDFSEQGWHLFESTQDLSKIKSLAFKILDKNNKAAVLPEETLFSIILNMQVPEESKVSKVDGKPTHSYSNVYARWRGTNESEVHGIHSETVKLSLKDSIIDDIEAKGNHQIIVEREYIGNFSESKKNLNRIVILKGRNNNKEYKIYKDKISFIEPDIYDIKYITEKDVNMPNDSIKEIEIKETFEDSLDKIKVKYQIKKNINNGYTDSDQKENLYAITLK